MSNKPASYNYYTIWSGALNFGDTPGVFLDSTFVGLIAQIPITINYIPPGISDFEIMLLTDDVEIFNGNTHPVYFDWIPGTTLLPAVGHIDDVSIIPNLPEYHLLKIPTQGLTTGDHSITIVVNLQTPMGLKDDFVLRRIDMDNNVGAKTGW